MGRHRKWRTAGDVFGQMSCSQMKLDWAQATESMPSGSCAATAAMERAVGDLAGETR